MPYIITIILSMAAIVAVNLLFPGARTDLNWLNLSLWTLGLTVGAIAVYGLFAFLIRRLPERWLDYKKPFFTVKKRERKFYKFIGVKSWRGLVIELGIFTSFSKSHFTDPNNPEYTARFLLESCYGVVIHIVCVFIGFVLLAVYPPLALRVALPVAIVNAVLNILPVFVLRYNTPKIKSIHERNLRKSRSENS